MHRFSFACLVLALVPAVLACDPGADLGTRCEYNSDCPEGLACVEGFCGTECRVHRDCPLQSECLIAEGTGLGRCRLPTDTCEQCTGGLVCGEDGLCHSPCGDRCPSDGICTLGACVRASGDAGTPADAPPRDAGTAFTHVACASAATCAPGQECVAYEGASSVCRTPCTTIEECGAHATCAQLGASITDYCSIPCDPVTNEGCPAADACDYVEALSGVLERMDASIVRPQVWDCRRRTSATPGTPCATHDECGVGQSCYFDGTRDDAGTLAQVCVQHCYVGANAGETGACPSGMRCNAWTSASPVPGRTIGFCDRL